MKPDIRITTLIENTTSEPVLLTEHGLSYWIEYADRCILFDTGQSDCFIHNAKVLDIDMAQADAIILSHGHYDHTGGLSAVLQLAPNAHLYIHPAAIEPKFCRSHPKARSIGMPDSAKQALHHREITWTKSMTQVLAGVSITGRVPRVNNFEDVGGPFFLDEDCRKPDLLLDDQALFIESSEGLIVILGCAHAGVVNTLQQISDLYPAKSLYAVMGGMHLVNAGPERIKKTIDAFRAYDLQKIGPVHCTGDHAIEKIKDAFPDRYFDCSAGKQVYFQ